MIIRRARNFAQLLFSDKWRTRPLLFSQFVGINFGGEEYMQIFMNLGRYC